MSAVTETVPINWTRLMLGFGAMVVGQFMAILDIQIVAASLPQIQAGIGASADEVSWIQTAYLIPEVVMIPLSGYLSRLWGTRNVYFFSCLGFVVMSVITGLSTSLEMMIVSRALQGFLGGAMIPTVFAVAYSAFPPEKRVSAGVVMGLIVTLAPTVGPTLGGHLTEIASWHWLFFINVPPGILVLALVWRYGDFDKGDPSLARGFDWWGLGLMAAFLMSLQYVLEEGSKVNWFEDEAILILTLLCVGAGIGFMVRSLRYRNPIVELRAFADSNFSIGFLLTFVTGATLFGGTFLLPLFLNAIRDYSSAEVGTTMVVSGLSMFLTAPLAGKLASRIDPRIPIFVGFTMVTFGMWQGHYVTAEWGFWEFAGVQAIRGVGIMLVMIAAQNVSMSTLKPEMVKNASGLINLARNVGGAVGLALLATTLSNRTAAHSHELSERIVATDERALETLNGLISRMQSLGVTDPEMAGTKAFWGMLQKQASVLAFGDAFLFLASLSAIAAVAVLFSKPKAGAAPPAEMH